MLQGRADARERVLLEVWKSASPQNLARFHEVVGVWGATGGLSMAEDRPASARRARVPLAAAAAVAFFTLGWAVVSQVPAPASADAVVAAREITTGAGEMATVHLDDGTVVRLAPRSRLQLRYASDREVWLEGRAFFGVAHDPARPFRVRTAAGDAIALGTRFQVGVHQRDLRVLVVEGLVEVSTATGRAELGPGKMAQALGGGAARVQEVEDVLPYLEWMGRSLVFRDTPLEDAAKELEHRFDVVIRFRVPELGSRTVTAAFTDEEVEEVLRVLCRAADVRCAPEGGAVMIDLPEGPASRRAEAGQ